MSSNFTFQDDWKNACIGGLIIGISAVLYLALYGRVCGISGIVGRGFDHAVSGGSNKERQAQLIQIGFILGLLLSSAIWLLPVQERTTIHPIVMLISGLCVGFGTRYGCGCTSGHGVCGLARRSKRSFVAVGVFLMVGMVSATLFQTYFPDLYRMSFSVNPMMSSYENQLNKVGLILNGVIVVCISGYLLRRNIPFDTNTLLRTISSICIGVLFGGGLILSGMVEQSKVIGFLNVNPTNFLDHWDPALMFVLCCSLLVSVTGYPITKHLLSQPLVESDGYKEPTATKVDKRLVAGAAIFGVGWGVGGVCPGPGVVVMMSQTNILDSFWMWVWGLCIGMWVYHPVCDWLASAKKKSVSVD